VLVLNRKTTERLVITMGGRNVEVQVLRINGRRVTLGISAPAEIPISRAVDSVPHGRLPGQPR
jgi:carbon storage regulator CsrA